jgi:hypothetical protein
MRLQCFDAIVCTNVNVKLLGAGRPDRNGVMCKLRC